MPQFAPAASPQSLLPASAEAAPVVIDYAHAERLVDRIAEFAVTWSSEDDRINLANSLAVLADALCSLDAPAAWAAEGAELKGWRRRLPGVWASAEID